MMMVPFLEQGQDYTDVRSYQAEMAVKDGYRDSLPDVEDALIQMPLQA